MKLSQLNQLTAQQAYTTFETCCVALRWVQAMVAARPFKTEQDVYNTAQNIWDELQTDDYLAAFEGHPQIGDVSTLRAKFANTAHKAGDEQSGMQAASDDVLQEMMTLNQAYLDKFGFIFIVCATGKSAVEMLSLIQARIGNNKEQELAIAAAEQAKITKIRLEKLL